MDITPKMVNSLKFLRSYAGSIAFAVAWNTLDNAGVFAAIDAATEYDIETPLHHYRYIADVCNLDNEVIDVIAGFVYAQDPQAAEELVKVTRVATDGTYLTNVRVVRA